MKLRPSQKTPYFKMLKMAQNRWKSKGVNHFEVSKLCKNIISWALKSLAFGAS